MSVATIPRMTAVGAVAGAAAMLLWLLHLAWPRVFVLPYVAALGLTALCGAYVLLATVADSYRNPRRGVRIRPIRGFDVAAGLLLSAPSMWALAAFLPAL